MHKKLTALTTGLMLLVTFAAPQIAAAATEHLQPWYRHRPGDQQPLILAHQGGEGEYPSNSKLAFTKAHQAGADALDTDVQVTKDGVLVLFHDDTLDSRTNGTGPISEATYAQLKTLDFAYNWSPDNGATFPYRGKGITVTTAQELLASFPHDRISMEIKPASAQAAKDVCTAIKQFGAQNRVLISSFAQTQMDAFRQACPTVATSATQAEALQFYQMQSSGSLGCYHPPFSSLQVPEQQNGVTIVTPAFVSAAHSLNLQVYVWTIDTPEQAQRLMTMGVDGLNTSYPKRIIEWLNSAH